MSLRSALGLDTRAERYTYGHDAVAGYTAARRIPDRWVQTTCGYCSVGCGMFIGVKDGRAVGVRGDPDHPVNAGTAVPEGPVRARNDSRRHARAAIRCCAATAGCSA